MRTNQRSGAVLPVENHEGTAGPASTLEQQLRRTVLSCLLFEDAFYEDGQTIAARIADLVKRVDAEVVAQIAVEARTKMHLRHAPLFIAREMLRASPAHKARVQTLLPQIILRADELAEFMAIYRSELVTCTKCGGDGGYRQALCKECDSHGLVRVPVKQYLANPARRGLAKAFERFDEYQLAKYNRDHAWKLRDVMFMTHPKPSGSGETKPAPIPHFEVKKFKRPELAVGASFTVRHTEGQGAIWTRLVQNELETPDTWEVALSAAGGDLVKKRTEWERLLGAGKLGPLALIRNFSNYEKCNVDQKIVRAALAACKPDRVLPFRFLAAIRYAKQYASELEQLMFKCLSDAPKLTGTTALLIDVSPSMAKALSAKSQLNRIDAACGLAVLLREIGEHTRTFAFSQHIGEVPSYRGLALADAIPRTVPSNGTLLGGAIRYLNEKIDYQRLIVVTDEESQDPVGGPKSKGFMVNVATYQHGVARGPWHRINGWSNAIVDYVRAVELEDVRP